MCIRDRSPPAAPQVYPHPWYYTGITYSTLGDNAIISGDTVAAEAWLTKAYKCMHVLAGEDSSATQGLKKKLQLLRLPPGSVHSEHELKDAIIDIMHEMQM